MSIDVKVASICVILKALGVRLDVSSKEDRITMQKAVYLSQVMGLDLGYRFGWYLNGPYSSDLADAYYQASRELTIYEGYEAGPQTVSKLEPINQVILERPSTLAIADWLEAVASIDFMIRVMKRSPEESIARCSELKPHLKNWLQDAYRALVNAKIIGNVTSIQ